MESEIEYRKINIKEKEEVKAFITEILYKLERKEFFMPFTEQEIEDIFDISKTISYGAYHRKKLIGMAQLYIEQSCIENIKRIINLKSNKVAELGGYLVLEGYRNKGIMKELETILINEAKQLNIEYIVETVHPENIASNKVTQYTGAKIVKTTNIGEYLRNIYLLQIT